MRTLRGKGLRPLEPVDFERFDASIARLGQLLRLLAIAQEAPVAERPQMRGEWIFVYENFAEIGPVLTPMVQRSGRDPHDFHVQFLTNELAQRLSADADARIRRASDKTLQSWTLSLVREGSKRLLELGAPE